MAYPETASFPSALFTYQDIPPWSDRIVATLVGDMDSSQTTFTISTTSVDGNTLNVPCILTIGNERIKVNTATGAAITSAVRGYAGSTATSHSSGDAVRANLTAFHWNRLVAEMLALVTFVGPNGSGLPASATTFKVSGDGNYTVPAYFTSSSLLEVELLAGGGGGSGATTNAGGGGGGAGEYCRYVLTGLTAGATITCTYGGGGNGGGTNSAGSNGGDTSIAGTWTGPSSPITAQGGKGGGVSTRELGGSSGNHLTSPFSQTEGFRGANGVDAYERGLSGGGGGGRLDANTDCQTGGGMNTRALQIAGAASVFRGGVGGGCPLGSPGRPNTAGAGGASSTMNATAGTGFGAGGGGGNYDSGTASAGSGSAGRPGCIIFRVLKA